MKVQNSNLIDKAVIVLLLSFTHNVYASGAETAGMVRELLVKSIASRNINKIESFLHDKSQISRARNIIEKHGDLKSAECIENHTSNTFFSVVCHVTYEKHHSGNTWTFFVFKDFDKYVGTKLELSDMIGKANQCASIDSFAKGPTGDIKYQIRSCDE
jgi:hypothetical protein